MFIEHDKYYPSGFGIYYCVEYLKPTFRVETLFIFREAGMQIYEEAKSTIKCLQNSLLLWYFMYRTNRSIFEARIKEHIADTNHNCIAKSALAEHSSKSKHLIHFDQTQILARDPYYSTRLIREALEIEKNPNNLNRDDGLKLSQSWAPIINKISNLSAN